VSSATVYANCLLLALLVAQNESPTRVICWLGISRLDPDATGASPRILCLYGGSILDLDPAGESFETELVLRTFC